MKVTSIHPITCMVCLYYVCRYMFQYHSHALAEVLSSARLKAQHLPPPNLSIPAIPAGNSRCVPVCMWLTPTARGVWSSQLTPTARGVWSSQLTPTARGAWNSQLTPTARGAWNSQLTPTARGVWSSQLTPTARGVWSSQLTPTARGVWSSVHVG